MIACGCGVDHSLWLMLSGWFFAVGLICWRIIKSMWFTMWNRKIEADLHCKDCGGGQNDCSSCDDKCNRS